MIEDTALRLQLAECGLRAQAEPSGSSWCPLVWDSWSCYNATPPGSVANARCPAFQHLNFDPSQYSEKAGYNKLYKVVLYLQVSLPLTSTVIKLVLLLIVACYRLACAPLVKMAQNKIIHNTALF